MKKNDYQSPEELAMQEALDRIREEYPDFWMDMDGLSEDTTKTDSEKRQRRKFRRRLIAACFIGVCLLSTALTIFVNSDTAHAVKFAMEKKYYQAKGWVQATDPGSVNDNNSMIIVETNEENIPRYKSFWSELKYPSYMTDNYSFKELTIEKSISGIVSATYQYENHNEMLVIVLKKSEIYANTQLYFNTIEEVEGKYNYKKWFDNNVEISGLDVIIDGMCISIMGSVADEELKRIVNGLE